MEYKEEISKIHHEILDYNIDIEKLEDEKRFSFLQFTSSKKHFFPKNTKLNNLDFYNKVKTNQALSTFDLINYIEIKDNIKLSYDPDTFKQPKIYCTFHYGSYKVLNCILHDQNIDFSVIVNKVILEKDEDTLIELHEQELIRSNKKNDFQIINANSNSGLIKMIRALKQGKSLVIYIDGNSGVEGFNNNSEKTVVVNFLNKEIYSRTGVAFLSNHLNIPIVPVISSRSSNYEEIRIKFYDEIKPTTNNEESIRKTTQKIWDIFSKEVSKDPTQWASILCAHHFLKIKDKVVLKGNNKEKYSINKVEFDFFKKADDYYLYSHNNFWTFKLSNNIFKLLRYLEENNGMYSFEELSEVVHEDLLKDLINKEVLI